jgi:hypothetical protein
MRSIRACAIMSAGSEIAGEAAAGLAAAYIALKANSGASSAELASYLTHAKQLYSFATSAQGSYQDLTSECLAQHGVGSHSSLPAVSQGGLPDALSHLYVSLVAKSDEGCAQQGGHVCVLTCFAAALQVDGLH